MIMESEHSSMLMAVNGLTVAGAELDWSVSHRVFWRNRTERRKRHGLDLLAGYSNLLTSEVGRAIRGVAVATLCS